MNVNGDYSIMERKKSNTCISQTAFSFFFQEQPVQLLREALNTEQSREGRASERIAVYHQSELGCTQTWYIIHETKVNMPQSLQVIYCAHINALEPLEFLLIILLAFLLLKRKPNNQI